MAVEKKPRIKIADLPKDQRVNRVEMRKVTGGFIPQPEPPGRQDPSLQFIAPLVTTKFMR